jgi:hypothetical protein
VTSTARPAPADLRVLELTREVRSISLAIQEMRQLDPFGDDTRFSALVALGERVGNADRTGRHASVERKADRWYGLGFGMSIGLRWALEGQLRSP